MKKRLICLGMALIFSLAGGCSSAPAPPSFYPVWGQIILDGHPVRFANVSLTPKDLANDDAPAAIDFYRDAFGAVELGDRFTGPHGELIHAEIQIGDSVVMITDEAAVAHEQSRRGLWAAG